MINGSDPLLQPPNPRFPVIYPFVSAIYEPHAYSAGQFVGSRPFGVTVHVTADDSIERVRRTLKERHLGYHLVIDFDGKVTQLCYLDRRTNHAGPSNWRGNHCNEKFAAVALLGWGVLDKDDKTWTGEPVGNAVTRPGNVGAGRFRWQPATAAQEKSLLDVLGWFRATGCDPANFCGHDEAAVPPGRKTDPGGALSMTMSQIRAFFGVKS